MTDCKQSSKAQSNMQMEFIDIDKRDYEYSNEGVFTVLKNYIEYEEKIYDDEGNEIDLHFRLLVVCIIMSYLTNEKILNHTLDVLQFFGLIDDDSDVIFQNVLLDSYSEIDAIKIKAICYSLISRYNLNQKFFKIPNAKKPKYFNIKLKDRVIEHNLNEVQSSMHENNVIQFKNNISRYPVNIQKNKINKWIQSALDVGYSKNSKMFNDDIEYLKGIRDSLIEPETPQQLEAIKVDENKNRLHPSFNPNLWNQDCFELFKYIFDEYYKGTKRQITNIWFYLKESGNKKYILKATKDLYENFILENYQIKITNFDKAEQKWEEKERPTIDDHRKNFEDTLKQNAEKLKNT